MRSKKQAKKVMISTTKQQNIQKHQHILYTESRYTDLVNGSSDKNFNILFLDYSFM
jgi:hypothetical protein